MPMELYQGRSLEPEELKAIRQQIEQFDTIEAIDPEMRGIVERNWPHLVAKLPPEDTMARIEKILADLQPIAKPSRVAFASLVACE